MAADVEQNIAKLKVNEMIELFTPLIAKAKVGKDMPSINLSGPPGVGKSDGIRELAARVAKLKGKTAVVHDVRLLNMNPVDLRGIPAKVETSIMRMVDGKPQEEKVAVARWLRPEIFQMDERDDIINFLFLDEITAAPQSVQSAAYQIVLDRKIGEHELPSNCFVFAAGNRVIDKSVAYRMPKALANRMCHLEIYADLDDWKKWALANDIDERIIGFLNFCSKPALFAFDPSNDDLAYPTPRSWAKASEFLKMLPNLNFALPLVAGCVGMGMATEFLGYTNVYASLPNVNAIFEGKAVEHPKKMDVCYALSSSLVSMSKKANKNQLNNMLTWMVDWAADYTTLTIKDMIKIDDMINTVSKCKAWVELYKKNQKFISTVQSA